MWPLSTSTRPRTSSGWRPASVVTTPPPHEWPISTGRSRPSSRDRRAQQRRRATRGRTQSASGDAPKPGPSTETGASPSRGEAAARARRALHPTRTGRARARRRVACPRRRVHSRTASVAGGARHESRRRNHAASLGRREAAERSKSRDRLRDFERRAAPGLELEQRDRREPDRRRTPRRRALPLPISGRTWLSGCAARSAAAPRSRRASPAGPARASTSSRAAD